MVPGKDRVLIASPSTWSSSLVKSTTYTEFQISTVGNDFVFKAASPAVAKKWVKLLSQRIAYTLRPVVVPACLPACLAVCLAVCLPACLRACLTHARHTSDISVF